MGSLSSALLSTPKYELKLPSNGKRVEYRPFLVKEEKALLIASESKSEKDMYLAMRDVVAACTFNKIEVENLPLIDVEYLFLKIRARSVGETATPRVACPNCNTFHDVSVNLNEIEAVRGEGHAQKINLSPSLIVEMRYPRYSDIEQISEAKDISEMERAFETLAICVEKVHTPNETFVTAELSKDEVLEFIGNLTQSQFKKLMDFFETSPRLEKTVDYKCKKCNESHTITLRSIKDFF